MYIKWKLLVNTVNTCTFKPTYSHCKWFAFSPLIVKLNCKKQCRVTLSTGWCFCLCQGRLEPAGRHEQWESHGSIRGRDEESSTGGTWHFYRTHIFKFNVFLILSTQYRWKYDILIDVLTNHFDVKRITFWAARSLALQSNRFTVTLWSSTFQKINEFLSSMLPGQMNTGVCNEPSSDQLKFPLTLQVIDTMPMNEKTATLFHHFEPLYLVIDDMPRPPESLLTIREGQRLWGSLPNQQGPSSLTAALRSAGRYSSLIKKRSATSL